MGYPQPPGGPPLPPGAPGAGAPPPPPPTQPYGTPGPYGAQPYSAQPYGAQPYAYQPAPLAGPAYHQGGSPAKIVLIVVVVVGLLGGGALLVTQLTKKSPTPTTLVTPTTIETPKPTTSIGTTSSISTSSSGSSTTRTSTSTSSSTRPTSTTSGGGSGQGVPVGGGASVTPASGWSVRTQQSDLVVLTKSGALFHAETVTGAGDTSADAIVGAVGQALARNISNFQTASARSLQPPKSNITSFAGAPFRGTLAGQQGSTNVEGLIFVAVRQDGLAAIVYTVNGEGQTDTFTNDYSAMLGSILASL